MRGKGHLVIEAALILLVLALVVGGLKKWHEVMTAHPFAGRQVIRMKAFLDKSPQGLPEVPEFEVPKPHITRILAALEPAQYESQPMFWQVLGQLTCVCADGETLTVGLYRTFGPSAAFSVVPSKGWSGRKPYYRGGTDKGIEDAARQAYEDAQKWATGGDQ
jgi:hypothetical protein